MPDPLPPAASAAADIDPALAEAAGEPRAVIVRQLQVLGELAELGLDIARAIARQAATEAPGEAPAEMPGETTRAPQVVKGDVSLAYARVARAVRLTIALQSRLLQDLRALDEVAERHLHGGRSNTARERKARVRRILDRVIDAEVGDAAEGDRLAGEVRERLENDDIYGDVLARPVGEIVAMICRDLGLSPDWVRLAEEAWAQDEIAGGQAGSPFIPPRWRQPNPLGHDAATESDPMAPQAASPQAASPQAASP
jgi:hypothetical protein